MVFFGEATEQLRSHIFQSRSGASVRIAVRDAAAAAGQPMAAGEGKSLACRNAADMVQVLSAACACAKRALTAFQMGIALKSSLPLCGTGPRAHRSSTTRVASGGGTQMELCSANVCGSRVKIFCRTLSWSCSVDSHRCPTLVRIPLLAQTLRNCSLLADKLCSKDRTDTATCSCKHRKSKAVKRQYAHQDVLAANRPTCTAPCGQHARYENDNAAMQPVALLTYNIVVHWSCTAVLAHSVTVSARTHFEKEQRILRVRLRIQNCLLENMPKPFYSFQSEHTM